jgi:YidC/Oxa1 family membrane protein insertase
MFWTSLVELVRAVIFAVAHVCNGSLGLAVCVVSVVLRLLLLPLTLRLARRALEHQRRLATLKPELERVQRRYRDDPAALWRETAAVHRRRGVKPVDPAGFFGGLVQLPLFAAFYAALRGGVGAGVRFLGIGDLAGSSALLGLVVAVLTAIGVAVSPSAEPAPRIAWVPILVTSAVTFWILASTSAVFTLATAAGSLVNVAQALLLRRRRTPSTPHRRSPANRT